MPITTQSARHVVTDSPKAFIKLLKEGVKHLTEAAMMLKRLVEADPKVIDRIREMEPSIAPAILSKLLLVADGHMMPELLINRAPAYKQLQSMPIEVQKAALKRPTVEVVVDSKRKAQVRQVKLAEIAPRHVAQVFSPNGIRTPAEQREYLKHSEVAKAPVVEVGPPWVVKSGKCIIKEPCVLTEREIEKMLAAVRASRR